MIKKTTIKTFLPLIIILVVSAVFFFGQLGRDMLYEWDECIYGAYAQSVRAGQALLINQYNGQLVFDKPPLYTWMLTAVSGIGDTEFILRSLSALAGLALIASIYLFTNKYISRKAAIVSSLLMLTLPSVITRIRSVNTDIFFTLFIFLAFWVWVESFKRPRLTLLSGTLLGLAVMVKGLSAGIFLGILVLCGIVEFNRNTIHRIISVVSGFLIIIVPWHMTVFFKHPQEFFSSYLYDNVLKRSQFPIENHREPWWFYLKQLAQEYFPWIVFASIAPFSALRRVSQVRSVTQFRLAWSQSRILFTLLLLVIVPLMVFTKSKTRLSWYILPLTPFISILLSYYITVFLKKFSDRLMQGVLGKSLVSVIFIVIVGILTIDAFTTLSRIVQLHVSSRSISFRDQAVLAASRHTHDELHYLVPFSERQFREYLPQNEQIAQTWYYGGNACAVYYSQKKVNYYYYTEQFTEKLASKQGLYMIENGDIRFIEKIPNKTIIYNNTDYTVFAL